VRDLTATDLVTPQTRAVLRSRLEGGDDSPSPRFLSPEEFATLAAACARLIPQDDRVTRVDLPANIDWRLAEEKSDGWRYDGMPSDGEAYRQGLRGLDESARVLHRASFHELDGFRQDDVLAAVQRGTAPSSAWATLPQVRFFEELLAELCECYYSDPLSQEEIGYVGMADARGWHRIGLNERESHEPGPLEDTRG
jgi:hypothetical protein